MLEVAGLCLDLASAARVLEEARPALEEEEKEAKDELEGFYSRMKILLESKQEGKDDSVVRPVIVVVEGIDGTGKTVLS